MVGGFTELKWDKSRSIIYGDKGFIFSVDNNKFYYDRNIYYIESVNFAVRFGITFGNNGFTIFGHSGYGYDLTNITSPSFPSFDVPGICFSRRVRV